MKLVQISRPILALALALTALGAQAHRTWLLPSATQLEGKEAWVTVDAAVSENLFNFDTNALPLDGLTIAGPGGVSLNPENVHKGRLRSTFDLKLGVTGTYRVGVAADTVMASYRQGGEVKRWRGSVAALANEVPAGAEDLRVTYQHARMETFVTLAQASADVLVPRGKGLEVVPLTHPFDYVPKEAARFRLLLDGKPLAGVAVSVVPGGVRYRGVLREMTVRSDEQGAFTVTWPEPGMYWLSTSYPPRPAMPPGSGGPGGPGGPGATPGPGEEHRYTYSATLEVLPQ